MASKVALITGSGKRRIGYHVAAEAVRRGYAVSLNYHSESRETGEILAEFEAAGGEAIATAADVSRESDLRRLVDETVKRFGRIDVVVTAAAVWPRRKLEEITADTLLSAYSINTLGTFLCAKFAAERMYSQPSGGAIVTVGDWAIDRPYLDHADYFISKGAIPTLTRVLAKEFAARNPRIRVNAILPGPILAPDDSSKAAVQERADSTLLKRADDPAPFVAAVFALIENDFITGSCLTVDGGRTIAD